MPLLHVRLLPQHALLRVVLLCVCLVCLCLLAMHLLRWLLILQRLSVWRRCFACLCLQRLWFWWVLRLWHWLPLAVLLMRLLLLMC